MIVSNRLIEWLTVGLGPFRTIDVKRDYFIPLARPDLQGCIERLAEAADATAYSRSPCFLSPVHGVRGECVDRTPAAPPLCGGLGVLDRS